MARVERIRLDKDMRGVSYAEIFEKTLGRKPTELLHPKTEISITIPIGESLSERGAK
jgi:hypothetical protein